VDFATCPAKWIASRAGEDATDSTVWGSLVDCLLMSPSSFDALFAVAPETYPDTKTGEPKPFTMASNWCKGWAKEQEGKTIVKLDVLTEARKAVAAINANEAAAELFTLSQRQVFIFGYWQDKSTGLQIPFRVLLDLVPPADHPTFGKCLADFKTARNGDPAKWPRVIDDNNYDWQSALYIDLYLAAKPEDRTDFFHVVQENVPPYHVVTPFPSMSAEFLEWGRNKYKAALRKYAQCLSTGVWPSYEPAGLVAFGFQYLSPDDCWNYRKTAGGFTGGPRKQDDPERRLGSQYQQTDNTP
jgi:hypothetical protein